MNRKTIKRLAVMLILCLLLNFGNCLAFAETPEAQGADGFQAEIVGGAGGGATDNAGESGASGDAAANRSANNAGTNGAADNAGGGGASDDAAANDISDDALLTDAPGADKNAGTSGAGKTGGDQDDGEDGADDGEDGDSEGGADGDEEEIGDLTADGVGIVLEGEGSFDVLISGTLKSGDTPILVGEGVSDAGQVYVTVWKIEGSKDGGDGEQHVVLQGDEDAAAATDLSNEVEAEIQYIIKIEPEQESMFSLDGVGESHGYDVAKETDKVTMKINVPEGYTLTGAYNGDGEKVPLSKDENGEYYVVVPRGGGVYLSAKLEKNAAPSSGGNDFDWNAWGYSPRTDKPEDEEAEEKEAEYAELLFILTGGTLDDDPGPISYQAQIGKSFTLPKAPEKPGAVFVRWVASCAEVTASRPGQSFVVKRDLTFIAVWRCEDSGPYAGNYDDSGVRGGGDDDDDDDDESGKGITVEGDDPTGLIIEKPEEIEVDGPITVKGGQGATGVRVSAAGETEVETDGGMTVSSGGSGVGIDAAASGGDLSFEFEGNVTVSASGGATGVQASSGSGGNTSVEVEGNVSSSGTGAVLTAEAGKTTLIVGENGD